ncbi:MAG: DUF6514 family protein [Oscillospiraceae bacterium]|nr:DUF6514 family protein [Oscillospiraceae bacterium]
MSDTKNTSAQWNYCVIDEMRYHQDVGNYRTYGLLLNEGHGSVCLQDISVQRAFVERMAETFNRLQLAPVHLHDAVENLLP